MARPTRDQRTTNAVVQSTQFGALLRQLRAAAGLTQTELAERARMSWRGIADLERGVRRSPYPSTVRRLAEALSLTPADRVRLVAASGRSAASINSQPLRTPGITPLLSSFIGRESELAHIKHLFTDCRLLTLTGSPGVGKTRLAYEAARSYAEDFADGAAAIELTLVNDPVLVPHAVADSLGIADQPGQLILATLEDTLRERQVLLVLDNCEHLLLACAALVDRLLRGCPGVRIIASSRAPLRVPGEVIMEVLPLSVPELANMRTVEDLAQSEAVQLFVERCRTLQTRFVLTELNAATVAEVCGRLDGLPLALELAAARIRGLGLEEVAARLDDRFRLLTAGSRTAAPHQQTLLATLDWSYGLLSELDRRVLAAMSVFIGGADAWALKQIYVGSKDIDPIVAVDSLVEQSLVIVESDTDGQVRYQLLETVREYAQQRLSESSDEPWVSARHAEVYYKLVVGEGLPPEGAENPGWLLRLDKEHGNVRAALRWFVDAGELEPALRLASAAARYWDNRGHVIEGRQQLAEVLDLASGRCDSAYLEAILAAAHLARRDDDYQAVDDLVNLGVELASRIGDPPAVARLLTTRATAEGFRGDFAAARAHHEQALAIWGQLGDRVGIAGALNNLAIACDYLGDFEAARAALHECISLARHVAPGRILASALNNLGLLLHRLGNDVEARPLIQESLSIARQRHDQYATANACGSMGLVLHQIGELIAARRMFDESLAIRRQSGDRRGVATSLQNMGGVLLDLGEPAAAELLLDESLSIFSELQSSWLVADVLETLACVAAVRGDLVRSNTLVGDAAETRRRLGTPRPASLQARIDRWLGPTHD